MGEHAPLPPSGAPQWGNCSGSVVANAMRIDIETDASREGDAVHWVVSEGLIRWRETLTEPVCAEWVGEVAPNGVVIDGGMVAGAQVMIDDVMSVIREHKLNSSKDLMVEHRVYAPQIHEHNWGRLDVALDLRRIKVIYLWDYKNGYRETPAKNNLQMVNYLAGIVNEFGITGHEDQEITVVMRIVHPNCFTAEGAVDEWRVRLSDLRGHINQLHAKGHEALGAPTMSSGPWCRGCGSVGTCATARRSVYNWIDHVNAPFEIDQMDGAALATERDILNRGLVVGKARLAAIEDDLEHRIKNGATDTGLALQSSAGRLKWAVDAEQAIAVAGQFGVDISVPGVMTPTQAKAAAPPDIRAGFGEIIKGFSTRPSGSLKLINADDTIAARVFSRSK